MSNERRTNMKKALIEAYNELLKVNVNGVDVEHMYNALVRLAAVINAPEADAPEKEIITDNNEDTAE